MKHYLTTLILIMCIPALMFAQTTYYVITTGDNGNAGSEVSPWQTIQHAIDEANPGDIIEVAPGTYTETLFIPKSLTINGAEGTIVKPPADDPAKIINGYKRPLVEITAGAKSTQSDESQSVAVTITGIEFDCDFHPSINTGIKAIYYDLVFDNIKVHSILQEGDHVFGINISNAGNIAINNSEIYDIISLSEEEYPNYSAIGINIIGGRVFGFKSLHDEYDIVIADNELYDIVSEGDDTEFILFNEGSRAIQIIYASNVLISGNNIYSTSVINTPQKDLSGDPSLSGPLMGIFLAGLDGYNTVATNAFSYVPMAGLFVATPFIVFEDNEVSNSFIGFFGFGVPPRSEDIAKSASPIPHINLKLPVISPLKTNKSMSGGTWEFNNNRFDADEIFGMGESLGIVVLNFFDVSEPLKNAQSLDVKFSGNDIQKQIVGILIQNLGAGSYEVTDNVFSNNYMGLFVLNIEEANMMLDVYDNDFINNSIAGMYLLNDETIIADIYQNLFEGNGIGLVFESEDYTTISANNNQIINNIEYGISIGVFQFGPNKNGVGSLDATCNWWGTIDPTLIADMVDGDIEVFPYLLSDVTDPEDSAFMCGYQDFAMIPLSNHGLLLSILLIAGFSLFMLRARPL